MNFDGIGAAWLAAVLAPWAVSPHPNFSEANPSGPALLALVIEGRGQDRGEKYATSTGAPFESFLIDNAFLSTQVDSQFQGTSGLEIVSSDPSVPFAARTAAALLASVGLVETERHARALDVLGKLLSEIRDGDIGRDPSPSLRLCGVALSLQATVRLMETRQYDRARDELAWAKSFLPRGTRTKYEQFDVSKGISWGSSRVQADINVLLKSNVMSVDAHLEDVWGSKWEGIVRGRSGWLAMRQRLQDAIRDEAMLKAQYEKEYEATSGKIRFGGTPSTHYAWNALLSAELSGNVSRIKSGREAYARILILQGLQTAFDAQEALRLLRHANSKDMLNVVLKQVRSSGPLDAIKTDMQLILGRNDSSQFTTASDLRVLQSGSDIMTLAERTDSLRVIAHHLTTAEINSESLWAKQERVLKTLTVLADGTSTDSLVAESVLPMLHEVTGEAHDPAVDALVRFIDSIHWENVSSPVKLAWENWARPRNGASSIDPSVQAQALSVIRGEPTQVLGHDSLSTVVKLLSEKPVTPEALRRGTETLSMALSEQRSEARRGSRSFGSYDPFDLAVAFAIEHRTSTVWAEIQSHISESALDASQLARGLDRLALSAEPTPQGISTVLRSNAARLLEMVPQRGFFSSEQISPFPSAVRLLASEGLISDLDAMTAITSMMSQGVLGRLEAAKCSSRIRSASLSLWRQALLLQTSYDSDAEIVAEAGLGLAANFDPAAENMDSIQTRVIELLSTDGVTVPMRVLQGLYRNPSMQRGHVETVVSAVRILSKNSPSTSVRQGSIDLLEHLNTCDFEQ